MIEFTRGAAATRDLILVAAVLESSDVFEPDTRIFRYLHGEPPDWSFDDLDFDVQSICLFTPPDPGMRHFCALSSEGIVYHNAQPGPYREQISGAGVGVGGRLYTIAQIGVRLYAAGDNGQIYCRASDGIWSLLTGIAMRDRLADLNALLAGPPPGSPEFIALALDPARNPFSGTTTFLTLGGPSEDQIYIGGLKGDLRLWDGTTLRKLDSGTTEALTNIFVETPDRIWICGREGTLLRGNARDGFANLSFLTDHRLFTSIQIHDGQCWLASNAMPMGVFRYDTNGGRPERAPGSPRDIHTLSSSEGVLWGFGLKTIARYENGEWTLIQHPDL
jgi:hypothetical protein